MNIIAGAASMLEMASKSEKQAVKHHGKGRKCKRTLAKQDEQQKATKGPVKQEADTAPVSMCGNAWLCKCRARRSYTHPQEEDALTLHKHFLSNFFSQGDLALSSNHQESSAEVGL